MFIIFQMILFPLSTILDSTNITIGIFEDDKGKNLIELIQRLSKLTIFFKVFYYSITINKLLKKLIIVMN